MSCNRKISERICDRDFAKPPSFRSPSKKSTLCSSKNIFLIGSLYTGYVGDKIEDKELIRLVRFDKETKNQDDSEADAGGLGVGVEVTNPKRRFTSECRK